MVTEEEVAVSDTLIGAVAEGGISHYTEQFSISYKCLEVVAVPR